MKITVEIADKLLIAARKYAAKRKTTIRSLIENGLRHQLDPGIRWVTAEGGLPKSIPVADRTRMIEALMQSSGRGIKSRPI